MERSTDRILTTHVGSLPRPSDLIAQYQASVPASTLEPRLKSAVGEVVKQQVDAGIDVVNDGEYGKAMRAPVDYGAWWSYIYQRLSGFEVREGGTYGQNSDQHRARIAPTFASSTKRARLWPAAVRAAANRPRRQAALPRWSAPGRSDTRARR